MLSNWLKLKIKRPKDVYSAVYPLFSVCNIVGLAPYTLKKLSNGKRSFQFSIWPILRSVVLGGVFLALLAYQYSDEAFFEKYDDLKYKVRSFQESFASLLTSIEIIFGCFFTVKIIEVFKNIDEVDTGFQSLAIWVPYKKIYINIVIHLAILGVSTVLIIVIGFLKNTAHYTKLGNLIGPYDFFIMILTIVFPYAINIMMEYQYAHYLNILRMRYKLLNDYLETLIQKNTSYNNWIEGPISLITTEKSKEKLKISGKKPKGIVAISDPIFVVDQVVALHIKLTDTAHLINQAFCVQHLLRITLAFVSVVTALFLIAMNFSSNNDENMEPDITFTLWAFSNAMEVVAIVWITSETSEEANTCPRILHKIRNNTTNVKLQDTIEIYSLQMYHNRLYFSVCGLFPFDYTLLYTIVAGVTTYLVILIQFNIEFVKKTNVTTTIAPN